MVMVDVSHWNFDKVDRPATEGDLQLALTRAKTANLSVLFCKCTQGTNYVDHVYAWAQVYARKLGILFGAYHFLDPVDPVPQVEWFIKNANFDGNTLPILDFEIDGAWKLAEEWVHRFFWAKGVLPLLYTSRSKIVDQIGDNSTYLSVCDLWVASYLATPEIPPQWSDYTFWQYSNGQQGPLFPHGIDGIGNCDMDKFNPKRGDILDYWKGHAVSNIPLDTITVVATAEIPTFTPEGLFHHWIKVGDQLTVFEGQDKTINGILMAECPDDFFVPRANVPLPATPPTTPPLMDLYVWYPQGKGANLRSTPQIPPAGAPSNLLPGGTNNGDKVTIYSPRKSSGFDAVNAVNGKQVTTPTYILDSLLVTSPH